MGSNKTHDEKIDEILGTLKGLRGTTTEESTRLKIEDFAAAKQAIKQLIADEMNSLAGKCYCASDYIGDCDECIIRTRLAERKGEGVYEEDSSL